MRILIVGPPGAGKGTQGSRLGSLLGVPHISSGAVLRQAIAAGSPAGLRARHAVERGELVSDETVVELLRERFGAPDVARNGFLLDGFPRNVDQVRLLHDLDPDSELDGVVHLVAAKAVLRERLRHRGRPDDRASALRTRLGEYRRVTAPMLMELAPCAPIVVVDAAQSIDEVTDQILAGLLHIDSSPGRVETTPDQDRVLATRSSASVLGSVSGGDLRSETGT
jgi:adenylate kinase